jgi:hypothetical protein
MNMGKFGSFVSKPVSGNILPVGEHRVRLAQAFETDSFTTSSGEKKSDLPQWQTPTDQLYILCVSTEGKGSIGHRLQGQSWVKFANLTDEEIKTKKYLNIDGYACVKTKTGVDRVPDKAGHEACARIFDRFMNACGLPEGSTIEDLDTVIADKTEFMIVVVNDEYEGKDQFRIKSFKPVASAIPVVNDMEA